MALIRFRSRHLHATFFDYTKARLSELGWVNAPVNFGTVGLNFIDYQPDERSEQIRQNTVSISLGDYQNDEDEEVGAAMGGSRGAPYAVYIDVYMAEQALSQALCDDIRDIYTDQTLELIDQISGAATGNLIEVENVDGPSRIPGAAADQFKRHWRAMRLDVRLYFNT